MFRPFTAHRTAHRCEDVFLWIFHHSPTSVRFLTTKIRVIARHDAGQIYGAYWFIGFFVLISLRYCQIRLKLFDKALTRDLMNFKLLIWWISARDQTNHGSLCIKKYSGSGWVPPPNDGLYKGTRYTAELHVLQLTEGGVFDHECYAKFSYVTYQASWRNHQSHYAIFPTYVNVRHGKTTGHISDKLTVFLPIKSQPHAKCYR